MIYGKNGGLCLKFIKVVHWHAYLKSSRSMTLLKKYIYGSNFCRPLLDMDAVELDLMCCIYFLADTRILNKKKLYSI
jgi:hypothetical protein